MKANKTLILTATLSVLMAGCDNTSEKQVMPEVNEENCKPENIDKIKNKKMQQEFGARCFRRVKAGTKYRPSPPRSW